MAFKKGRLRPYSHLVQVFSAVLVGSMGFRIFANAAAPFLLPTMNHPEKQIIVKRIHCMIVPLHFCSLGSKSHKKDDACCKYTCGCHREAEMGVDFSRCGTGRSGRVIFWEGVFDAMTRPTTSCRSLPQCANSDVLCCVLLLGGE
jgi:hypothetical protein